MNKLSLVGMQLHEKYKENFDVSSESPSSGVTDFYISNFPERNVRWKDALFIFKVYITQVYQSCNDV